MSIPGTSDVSKLLAILRETPADTQAASDTVLGKIYQYLIAVPPSTDEHIHWFCVQANPTTVDAATFLIRLMAYNSAQVTEWKRKLHQCLTYCALCVQGLEIAKITSQETFLAAFNKHTLDAFFTEFNKWELREVCNDLERAEQLATLSDSQQVSSVDLPVGTVYRMVTNWAIFQEPRILAFLQRGVLSVHAVDLADYPIPPGMLVLLLTDNLQLRSWAVTQVSGSKMIRPELFSEAHVAAVKTALHVLNTYDATQSASSAGQALVAHVQFAPPAESWSGFNKLLRLLHPDWLRIPSGAPLLLRRAIMSHLGDQDSHFVEVLACFTFLLKRLGSDLWTGEEKEYAKLPLAAILGNPYFMDLLLPPYSTTKNLAWISEYLMTVRRLTAYEIVLERVTLFLCDNSRQERSMDIRPTLMAQSMKILQQELQVEDNATRGMVMHVLGSHFSKVVSLAYDTSLRDEIWKSARESARGLVETCLPGSVQPFEDVIRTLCNLLGLSKQNKVTGPLPTFSFQGELWRPLHNSIPTPDAIASALRTVARIAHLDILKTTVFKQLDGGEVILREINQSLEALQVGFSAWISSFAEYNTSNDAIDILQRDGIAKAVILLLMSPMQGFRMAGKTLTGLAFDVDDRMECFRAMLEKYPVEALDGILHFLDTFRDYAAVIPEASSLSAALVRCIADVLEVLCASPDGLLHNHLFLRPKDSAGPASMMPNFWKGLTSALVLIYDRAPMWASYVNTPDMVLWMRDALILARDVLKQWRVVEKASSQYEDTSSQMALSHGKVSLAQRLVGDLQVFLPALLKWLRLTDEELLHQSFTLLQSVFNLMKETHVIPSKMALDKLQKFLNGAKKSDQTASTRTRLDRSRLLQLSDILEHFQEGNKESDDDEVTIVSHSMPSKKRVSPKPLKRVSGEVPRYIQGGANLKKSSGHTGQSALQFASSKPPAPKFTESDQRKLGSAFAIPSFRKSTSIPSSAGHSQAPSDLRKPRTKVEPKNEALNQPLETSDSSNSSEPESDEETEGTEAFKGPSKPKSPKIKSSYQRLPRVKAWNEVEQTEYLQNRLARHRPLPSTAKRLPPDLSSFHRALLSWDYNYTDTSPPGRPVVSVQVPDRFESYDHYFRTFEPLLLLECWAQLQQSKEEFRDTYQAKVMSRTHVNSWLDVDISISESVKKEWYLAETDVVLLRQLGREKCIMAKVTSYTADRKGIQATLRCYIHSGVGDPGLQISTSWQISKVLSLSTLNREYEALQSLRNNSDICNFILRPSFPDASDVDVKDLRDTMQTYKVNEPQAAAILKAMKTEGFTLIQGPPGTGKTSTICGLIAKFLSKRAVPITVGKLAPSTRSRKPAPESLPPTARILVCAPSNAAIDELARRIRDGFIGLTKNSGSIKVVRIGTDQAINASVKDISLDYLVEQKLGGEPSKDISSEIRQIQQEVESIKQERRMKVEQLQTLGGNVSQRMTLENELKVLQSRREVLTTKLDAMKDQQKSDFRSFDTRRRAMRNEILTEADIVCSTLSGAGHDILASMDFDMIIIDEAAQAIELSSLIPLKYHFSRCVMVGDPKQLPPTVLSQESSRFGYNKSLFLRLQQSAKHVHLLSIQYRMHPDISYLPSNVFYDGKLLDGPGMAEKTHQPWHDHEIFGTYKFFNVLTGIEEQSGHSVRNPAECTVAVELYDCLRRNFPAIDFDFRVGVVSMYKAQIKWLRQLFSERFGKNILTHVDFNTVDGFQGQEKDIIILSCVRAGPGLFSVGFLSDVRRMNVALTRAKSSLFILGHAPTLERSDDTWAQIVKDARSRSALQNVDAGYFSAQAKATAVASTIPKKLVVDPPLASSATVALPPILTPQALKAMVDAKAAKEASSSTNSKKYNIGTPAGIEARGTKRLGEISSIDDRPSKPSDPQLPRKRQKQQTMFIPSKKRI